MRGEGVEPSRPLGPQRPQRCVSTIPPPARSISRLFFRADQDTSAIVTGGACGLGADNVGGFGSAPKGSRIGLDNQNHSTRLPIQAGPCTVVKLNVSGAKGGLHEGFVERLLIERRCPCANGAKSQALSSATRTCVDRVGASSTDNATWLIRQPDQAAEPLERAALLFRRQPGLQLWPDGKGSRPSLRVVGSTSACSRLARLR